MENDFLSEVAKVFSKRKIRYNSLQELASGWQTLVNDLAADGYSDYLVEYDNDLSIRYQIEEVLSEKQLEVFPEFKAFQSHIEQIDNHLKDLFLPNVKRTEAAVWWCQGILKNGTGDYANDVKEVYGIDLE